MRANIKKIFSNKLIYISLVILPALFLYSCKDCKKESSRIRNWLEDNRVVEEIIQITNKRKEAFVVINYKNAKMQGYLSAVERDFLNHLKSKLTTGNNIARYLVPIKNSCKNTDDITLNKPVSKLIISISHDYTDETAIRVSFILREIQSKQIIKSWERIFENMPCIALELSNKSRFRRNEEIVGLVPSVPFEENEILAMAAEVACTLAGNYEKRGLTYNGDKVFIPLKGTWRRFLKLLGNNMQKDGVIDITQEKSKAAYILDIEKLPMQNNEYQVVVKFLTNPSSELVPGLIITRYIRLQPLPKPKIKKHIIGGKFIEFYITTYNSGCDASLKAKDSGEYIIGGPDLNSVFMQKNKTTTFPPRNMGILLPVNKSFEVICKPSD